MRFGVGVWSFRQREPADRCLGGQSRQKSLAKIRAVSQTTRSSPRYTVLDTIRQTDREADMRTRLLALAALVSVPVALTAQGIGRRGGSVGGGQPPMTGATLPPQAPVVNQALSYHRSRWSAEGYTLISSFATVAPTGGSSQTNAFGAGTHADYRVTDHWSGTADMTAAFLGGSVTAQTAEVGTRYRPMPYNSNVRPYFDLRGVYTHIHDTFFLPTDGSSAPVVGPGVVNADVSRYSRGVGGMLGAGLDYTLTPTLALTTEFSAGRHRMDAYSLNGMLPVAGKNAYWMNVYRYTVGLRYNATTAFHMEQKAMK